MDIRIFTYTIHDFQWSSITWDAFYDLLGIKDFIYFISSSSIQEALWPVKIVFIFFTVFFFCLVLWLYFNSSYIKYQFLQDATEFFSRETYGLHQTNRSWKKIRKRIDSGVESDLRLAIIEADDFLYETLQDAGYQGATLEELIEAGGKKISNPREVLDAHKVRNAIVYEPDYNLDANKAKEVLSVYENIIKTVASS